MQKILIADPNEPFRFILSGILQSRYQVQTCCDGTQALSIARTFQPDVLILNLILPGLPAVDLLRALRQEAITPAVLVTSRYYSDHMMDQLAHQRVDHLVSLPCDLTSVADQVDELCAARLAPDPEHREDLITGILQFLGFRANQKGHDYARIAIELMAQDPRRLVTKEIYPAIGKQFEVSPESVEKALRSAISTAWRNRNDRLWRQYFSMDSSGQVPKPTNSQFLSRLADHLTQTRRVSGESRRFRDELER